MAATEEEIQDDLSDESVIQEEFQKTIDPNIVEPM